MYTYMEIYAATAIRAHTKRDILLAFRDAWTINENLQHSHTYIHTYIHRQSSSDEHPQTHTYTLIHFTNILMRWWWWKNLQMKKKSIFPSLFGKWCTNTRRFWLYIWNISEFMRKKNTYTEMSPLMMLLESPKYRMERERKKNPNLAKCLVCNDKFYTNFSQFDTIQCCLLFHKTFPKMISICLVPIFGIWYYHQNRARLTLCSFFEVRSTWAVVNLLFGFFHSPDLTVKHSLYPLRMNANFF